MWPQKFQMMKDSGSIRLEMLDEASLTRQPEEVTLNFPIAGKYFEPIQQIHSLRGGVGIFTLLTPLTFMLILLFSSESHRKLQCQVFDIVGKLGEGSYGSVFKALHKDSKQILAIKQVTIHLNFS